MLVNKFEGRGGHSVVEITDTELTEMLKTGDVYVDDGVVNVGIHEQLWYEFKVQLN